MHRTPSPRLGPFRVLAALLLTTLVVGCAPARRTELGVATVASDGVRPSSSVPAGAAAMGSSPMSSTSASAGAGADASAPVAKPNPEDLFPRGPTLLAGPFRLDAEAGKSADDCKGMRAYAFYGDPTTRVLDAVWEAGMIDCSKGAIGPVERIPTAARLVDAFTHQRGVYAVLESVATRAQPGGLRTVIDVADPRPTGIVAPGDRAALLPLLPPARVFDAALLMRTEPGFPPDPPPRGPATPPVEAWLASDGLAIEEVFQDHFGREIARRGPRDPLVATVARQLRENWPDCRASRFDDEPVGVCWAKIGGHAQVSFVLPPKGGAPLVRALGDGVRGKRLFGTAAAPQTPDEHRAAIQAFADRQPVRGSVIAAGPLGPWGGSIGVLLVPSPEPCAYVLRADGPAMSIAIPDPLRELPAALRDGGKTEALVIADPGKNSRILLRIERAAKRPWATLVHTQHPLEDEQRVPSGRDIVEDERSVFRLLRAKSITEAESIVRAPPVRATAAELTELFGKIGDRDHLMAHAAKNAVFIAESAGTNLGDAPARPIAEVSVDALRKLQSFAEERWVKKPIPSGDEVKSFFEKSGPTGPSVLVVDVWLTREDGKLRVAAVVER